MCSHRVVVGVDPQELNPPEHGIEWGPELVGERGEEVVLHAPGTLCLVGKARRFLFKVRDSRGLALERRDALLGEVNSAFCEVHRPRHGGECDEEMGETRHSRHEYPLQMQRKCPYDA
jgi:hypothetical protein